RRRDHLGFTARGVEGRSFRCARRRVMPGKGRVREGGCSRTAWSRPWGRPELRVALRPRGGVCLAGGLEAPPLVPQPPLRFSRLVERSALQLGEDLGCRTMTRRRAVAPRIPRIPVHRASRRRLLASPVPSPPPV